MNFMDVDSIKVLFLQMQTQQRKKTERVAKTQGKTAQRNTDTVKKKQEEGLRHKERQTQGKTDTVEQKQGEAKTQGKTDTGRDRQGGEMMWDSPLCCNYH